MSKRPSKHYSHLRASFLARFSTRIETRVIQSRESETSARIGGFCDVSDYSLEFEQEKILPCGFRIFYRSTRFRILIVSLRLPLRATGHVAKDGVDRKCDADAFTKPPFGTEVQDEEENIYDTISDDGYVCDKSPA